MHYTIITPLVAILPLIHSMAINPADTSSNTIPTLSSRDGTQSYLWELDDLDGDVHVEISDRKLNFGHRVPSSTLEEIGKQCEMGLGCDKEGNDALVAKTWMVDGRWGSEKAIKMDVTGEFSPKGTPGDKADMLRIAKEVFEKLYAEDMAKRKQGVPYWKKCYGGQRHGCDPATGVGPFYTDQWTSTSEMIIIITGPRVPKQVYFHVTWSYPKAASASGLCSAFVGGGSAAAAMASGGWAAGLSIGYFACLLA